MHYALYEPLLLTSVVEGISCCSKAKDDAARQRPRIESRSQHGIYIDSFTYIHLKIFDQSKFDKNTMQIRILKYFSLFPPRAAR